MSVSYGIWSIRPYCHFGWCFFIDNVPLFWAAKPGQIAYNYGVSSSSWGKKGSEKVRANPIHLQRVLRVLSVSLVLRKVVWNLWLEGSTRKRFRMGSGSNVCTSYTERTVVLAHSDLMENKLKYWSFKGQRQHQKSVIQIVFQDFADCTKSLGILIVQNVI